MKPTWIRRRLFVDRFHYKLFAVSLSHFLIILSVFVVSLFMPLMFELDDSTAAWERREIAADQFLSFHLRVWPPLVIAFLLLTLHAAIVTHRIAGPLYRLRRIFHAIGEGDLAIGVTLRKRDYLVREAEMVNQMLISLAGKIQGAKDSCRDLMKAHEALQMIASRSENPGFVQLVQAQDMTLKALQHQLDQLRTGR